MNAIAQAAREAFRPGTTVFLFGSRVADSKRGAGLRPVQLWVPDTRRPNFVEECRRQSRLVAEAERGGTESQDLMDIALVDVEGWTD